VNDIDDVGPDIEELFHRISELEARVEESKQIEQMLQESEERFRRLTEIAIETVLVVDSQGLIVDAGPRLATMFGYEPHEVIGKSVISLSAAERGEQILKMIRIREASSFEIACVRKDGSSFYAELTSKPALLRGRTMMVLAILDVTARKEAEDALRASIVHEELIQAQAQMLAELSTPLLPISDEVVVLPLVGEVNDERAQQVIETLTQGVIANRAAYAILDITGMAVVGARVVDMLVRAARAVGLLGARVVLTGVRPEVAQTIVRLGTDLGRIVTMGTLHQGVAYALQGHRRAAKSHRAMGSKRRDQA